MITEQAKQRCRILAFWEKHGALATTEAFNMSERTLFRWQKELKANHGKLEALNPGDKTPKTKRKRDVEVWVKEEILNQRNEHPGLGKEKIHALLKEKGYQKSVSTVGRIIYELKEKGELPKRVRLSLSGKTGKLLEYRVVRKKKQRRPKGEKSTETDTIVRFIDGIKRYVATAIDAEGKFAFAFAYKTHGSKQAADLLQKYNLVSPTKITALQTDNGSEFNLHFESACQELGIIHYHIYPRSPKMNCHIERFNRTLQEEFIQYNRGLLRDDIDGFNQKLCDWLLWYNTVRPHHSLGLLSPLRYICSKLSAQNCQMLWTDTSI
jgi:transposase InsO family protein